MTYGTIQRHFIKSFVSYCSIVRISDEKIHRCFQNVFTELEPLIGREKIVWGPAVHKATAEFFDDALMYVVQSGDDPSAYTVGIRGTNPLSIHSWLSEDLWVKEMTPWSAKGASNDALISMGAYTGLSLLTQHMKPAKGSPGEGQFIKHFLDNLITKHDGKLSIVVTGHSLGGAMAPILALWLRERLSTRPETTVKAVAFAGPTTGNSAFVKYANSILGDACECYNNKFDVVPQVWNVGTLEKAREIFSQCFDFGLFKKLFAISINAAQGRDYTPMTNSFAVDATFEECPGEFALQLLYQHVMGYFTALNIDPRPILKAAGMWELSFLDGILRVLGRLPKKQSVAF